MKLGGLERSLDSLLHVQDLLIAACGTSLFAASYGAKIMRSLGSFATVQLEDAAEVVPDSLPTARKHSNGSRTGGICVVSQSGETKDTHRALVLGMENDLPAFSVVNQVGSLIARTTGCGVYLNAGREHAVASTKAFSTQVRFFLHIFISQCHVCAINLMFYVYILMLFMIFDLFVFILSLYLSH